ncbi:MAG TPA: hypothetical protein VG052_00660 [Puia sp.]|jgi:hypothetical protein|nr:hypothetical protein [Puia sp.]
MKITPIILICVTLSLSSAAQSSFNDSIAHSRNLITRSAMITLGSWATANIASGFILAGNTSGAAKYTWRMNGYWNFINLGLAGMGYLRATKDASKSFSLIDNYDAQNALEKIYIFNFGLDLAYIAGGFYLRERGMNSTTIKSADQLKGYGTSIILQGGFLLLMDGAMILLHHRNTLRLRKKMR